MRMAEAVLSCAVVAVAAGGTLFAMSSFGRFTTHQAGPVRAAATLLAQQTLRVAQDAWKYGSPGNAPAGSANVRVPIVNPGAAATSAPVTVMTTLSNATAADAQVTVQVTYTPDPGHPADSGTVEISGAAVVRAPPPGSQVVAPAPVPAPSGAP